MSRETFEAMQEAINAHVRDENPDCMPYDMAIVVASQPMAEGEGDLTSYSYMTGGEYKIGRPLHVTRGLLVMAVDYYGRFDALEADDD